MKKQGVIVRGVKPIVKYEKKPWSEIIYIVAESLGALPRQRIRSTDTLNETEKRFLLKWRSIGFPYFHVDRWDRLPDLGDSDDILLPFDAFGICSESFGIMIQVVYHDGVLHYVANELGDKLDGYANMIEKVIVNVCHYVQASRTTSRISGSGSGRNRKGDEVPILGWIVHTTPLRPGTKQDPAPWRGGTHAGPCRHIRRSFLRWQAHGKGRKEHRLITVPSTWVNKHKSTASIRGYKINDERGKHE